MGRYLFGIAALAIGAASLAMHDQLVSSWSLPGATIFLDGTSLALIAGGVATMFPTATARGMLLLGIVYALFTLTFLPQIFNQPAVYASWGDVFYALALVAGAMASNGFVAPAVTIWGLCNISFAIEQLEFFARTASLVPAWIPGGGAFWTVVTTAALALGGIALLMRRQSLLASRLLALMFLAFGITIWIPMLLTHPSSHGNWSEGLETFAIAGTAWIVADALAASHPSTSSVAR